MIVQNVVEIDGKYYNARIPEGGIKRSFQVLDDEDAGRVRAGDMHRSVIGTYYNYTIEFDTDGMDLEEYDRMYEVVSAPVDSHIITVPYGQDILTFEAYITSGEDFVKRINRRTGERSWKGLTLAFVAMRPQRR